MSNPLQDFFALIAEEKKKQEEAMKPKVDINKRELNINESLAKLFSELENTDTPIEAETITEELIQEEIHKPVEEIVEEQQDGSSKLIEAALGLLGGDNSEKNKDALTPLDQDFVTFKDLKSHYSVFVNRVQQSLSTLGGGGETKFFGLDDVIPTDKNNKWVLNYDAATQKIRLTDSIGPISSVVFDTTHIDDHTAVGTLCWSDVDETLNLHHPDGVVQQIGQETYGFVRNKTGSTITNGMAVRFAGAEQNGTARLLVAPFQANNQYPTLYGLGVATQDIEDGGDGRITVWGKVRNVDTSKWNVGDILFVSPDSEGMLTNIRPTAPNNVVPMAAVLRKDSSEGELFVRPSYEQQKNYANYISDSSQSASLINTPYRIRLTEATLRQQFRLSDSDNASIIALEPGLYTFQSNIQVISTNASAKNIWFWLRKNGVDVPLTTRKITLASNGEAKVFNATHNISMDANDYVTHMWATSDITARLDAPAATAFAPQSPSVIIDITQPAL